MSKVAANQAMAEQSLDSHFKKLRILGTGAFGYVDLCIVLRKTTYAEKGDKVSQSYNRSFLSSVVPAIKTQQKTRNASIRGLWVP